ncbi:hypothetical protein ACE14D_01195 [Streptomyces sp. Act-28]
MPFRHSRVGRDALGVVSAHLPAGSPIAVIGEWGSGKSSLGKRLGRTAAGDQDGPSHRPLLPNADIPE